MSPNSSYQVQVSGGHYTNQSYLSRARWSTYSVIIDSVLTLRPKQVLEIGPGPGLVTQALRQIGCEVKTLDLDPAIQPDYLISATDPSIVEKVGTFDLIIASEIFEHVEYHDFLSALHRLSSVSEYFILTLPDTNEKSLTFGFRFRLPLLNNITKIFKFRSGRVKHTFDGQHYWEIGKKGSEFYRIRRDIEKSGWNIVSSFLNIDNPYHRCLILKRNI